MTVKFKIFFLVLVPIFFLFGIITLYSYQQSTVYLSYQAKEGLTHKAYHYADRIDALLNQASVVATTTAQFLSLHHDVSKTELYAMLKANVQDNSAIYGASIAFEAKYSPTGKRFTPSVYRDSSALKSWDKAQNDQTKSIQWQWYNTVRQLQRALWTEPYIDDSFKAVHLISFSIPFYNQQQFAGVASVHLNLDQLLSLAGIQGEDSQQILLISPQNRLIFHHHSERITQPVVAADLPISLKSLLSQSKSLQEFHAANGSVKWLANIPIESTNWHFLLQLDKKTTVKQLNQTVTYIAVIVLSGLMLATLTAAWVINRIVNPIAQLSKATAEVSEGHLDVHILTKNKDEIGQLAQHFSMMVKRIQEREQALKNINRELEAHVSQRTLALEQSRANEEKFVAIFEGSNDAISLLEGQKFFDCNHRTVEMFGLENKNELFNLHPIDLSPPVQSDGRPSSLAASEYIARALEKGKAHFEWLHCRRNGDIFPAEILLSAFDYHGKKILQATIRDLTERKQNERRLMRSEYLLKLAQESSKVGFYVINLETGICENSNTITRILGIEETQQLTVAIWSELIHPEDKQMVIEDYHQSTENKQTFNMEYRIIRANDQEIRWVEVYGGFEQTADGQQSHYLLGTLQDISERKEIERKLQGLNQDLALRIQQRTEELVQAEKMASLGQLITGIAHEINTPLGAISSAANNMRYYLTESLTFMPRLFQSFSAQECEEFLILLHRSLDKNLRILSAKDQRQNRLNLEQVLSNYIEDMDGIADTLVDMGIYDEIDDILPLLQRQDSTEVLDLAYKLSEMNKGTQTINTAAERASKIVLALKSYAHRDVSGKKTKANLIDGIETVLTLYQRQLKQDIELHKNYDETLPIIYCYPDELTQVWTNLIHNALQAMDNKGFLSIGAKREAQFIRISIQDSGKGIAPEHMSKIFDAFFTTKAAGVGSGLGLHIIKKIVNKHEGKIEVSSQPGCTVFSVLLPIDIVGEQE